MPLAGTLLNRLRNIAAVSEDPEPTPDSAAAAEGEAHLLERRADMCQWLLFVRVGGALGVAGYLALGALTMESGWPLGALLLAAGYAAVNGAVGLGAQHVPKRHGERFAPWAYALLDVGLALSVFGLFGGAFAGTLAPGVVLVGLLVLVLLVYTLLAHPVLSTTLALAALGVTAAVFYVFPALSAYTMPTGGAEAPLRAYLLVEYLSIACLVTCLLALRLRRRITAHRAELHRRLEARVEADLEAERRRQVESVARLKRHFIQVLSHELRNPVAPLLSSLEVVKQDAEKGRCDPSLIGVATDSARELQHLVDDYTRLAELLMRPHGQAPRKNVPLAPLTEAVADRLADRFEEQPSRHLPHAPPVPRFAFDDLAGHAVAADPPLLSAAMRALLLRAARYATDGGTVTVRGFSENGEAGFTVHDPASHLDADALDALDDLFAPTDERLYSQSATGLELLLAQHALRRLGGRLSAASDPEDGTTIRCTLPAAAEAHDWVSEERARFLPQAAPLDEALAQARA